MLRIFLLLAGSYLACCCGVTHRSDVVWEKGEAIFGKISAVCSIFCKIKTQTFILSLQFSEGIHFPFLFVFPLFWPSSPAKSLKCALRHDPFGEGIGMYGSRLQHNSRASWSWALSLVPFSLPP